MLLQRFILGSEGFEDTADNQEVVGRLLDSVAEEALALALPYCAPGENTLWDCPFLGVPAIGRELGWQVPGFLVPELGSEKELPETAQLIENNPALIDYWLRTRL